VTTPLLVQVFLEAGEDAADFFGPAQIGDGIGNGVVILEAQNMLDCAPSAVMDISSE
jgi:hypothetical protein